MWWIQFRTRPYNGAISIIEEIAMNVDHINKRSEALELAKEILKERKKNSYPTTEYPHLVWKEPIK